MVATRGTATAYVRQGESGAELTFHFCPGCGSTVWWTRDSRPGVRIVAVGAFADPDFPPPRASYWSEFQAGWLDLPAEMPRHIGNG